MSFVAVQGNKFCCDFIFFFFFKFWVLKFFFFTFWVFELSYILHCRGLVTFYIVDNIVTVMNCGNKSKLLNDEVNKFTNQKKLFVSLLHLAMGKNNKNNGKKGKQFSKVINLSQNWTVGSQLIHMGPTGSSIKFQLSFQSRAELSL